MRRHNIFTLGIILTAIYGINAMADWPTTAATDVWANSEHTTLADLRCGDCCKSDCWLPNGTYYDNNGTFTETCGGLSCPSGEYDIGFSSCISASTRGSDRGYWEFEAYTSNTGTYGLTGPGQWGVTLYTGDKVTGIASCNTTSGTFGVATTTNFSSTVTGGICWCKMTSPSASLWVYATGYGTYSTATCSYACAEKCSGVIKDMPSFISGVFGSVEPGGGTPPTCDSHGQYSVVNGQCKLSSCDSDNGYYISGNICAYCNKDSFNTTEISTDLSNCQMLGRSKNCTKISGTSCSCANYSYGDWYVGLTGKYFGNMCSVEDGSDHGYWNFDATVTNHSRYGLTGPGQWGVTFSYGVIKGIASCNGTQGGPKGTSGTVTDQEFSNTSNGKYCWCKMTSPSASRWVEYSTYNRYYADECNRDCAGDCSRSVRYDSTFREAMYGSIE